MTTIRSVVCRLQAMFRRRDLDERIDEELRVTLRIFGFILDGFPRTEQQALDLDDLLDQLSQPLDAAVLMEEAGRMLASGPLAETLVALRVLAMLAGDAQAELLEQAVAGEKVITLAHHDIAGNPQQWLAGGAVAVAVIARRAHEIRLRPAGRQAKIRSHSPSGVIAGGKIDQPPGMG